MLLLIGIKLTVCLKCRIYMYMYMYIHNCTCTCNYIHVSIASVPGLFVYVYVHVLIERGNACVNVNREGLELRPRIYHDVYIYTCICTHGNEASLG